MKHVTAFLLALAAAFSLAACTRPTYTVSSQTQGAATRTVTDGYGRQVELPQTVERIVPLGGAPRMVAYLGLADRVVGIPQCEHPDSPLMAYAYVNQAVWAGLPNVGNDSLGAGEWYAEELVACAPDVILCTYEASVADDIQAQTGIPVVAVPSPELFSPGYDDALKIFAEACGVPQRVQELTAYLHGCLADLQSRMASIPQKEKPTVLGAGATFKGPHGIDGVYANYPVFQVLAANDVAVGIAEKSGGLLVDQEQILAWDPQIIFFDAGSLAIIQEEYRQNPGYFQQLQAVQNGQLYQWPNSTWHFTNVEIPLASAYYVGAMLSPEAFSDVEIASKISEIFDVFLGAPDYLEVLEAAGCGYGKVVLEG